jgi:hypothetical protein
MHYGVRRLAAALHSGGKLPQCRRLTDGRRPSVRAGRQRSVALWGNDIP